MVTAETFPSGLRFVTEPMPHVRSVSVGVWLGRGSRHESAAEGGVAHFVEHMLFKGTTTRSAREIAEAVDSLGGQLDAFTAKEYAGYYVKVLDEHLPAALELLGDLVMRPAFAATDIERERSVILEEIKMVEDAPDDLVHEVFTQQFWAGHALGRPILGTPDTVGALTVADLRRYFDRTYVAPNVIVAAAGNLDHARLRDLVARTFEAMPGVAPAAETAPPSVTRGVTARHKKVEQSHVCLGTTAHPQTHVDRHAMYVLNAVLGGSMSSRLFQHVREDRGLAYAVFSHMSAYTDAGMATVYAGCATEKVHEVVELTLLELRSLRDAEVPAGELRRAKDHLKGSLMLGLESTSSRMTHLARQALFFGRYVTLDDMLASIEAVSAADVRRVASDLFRTEHLSATTVGPASGAPLTVDHLRL
jgi:predicted Zn-dependent peptidase